MSQVIYQLSDAEMKQIIAEAIAAGVKEYVASSKDFERDLPAPEVMKRLGIKTASTFADRRKKLQVKPTRRVGCTDMYLLSDFYK